MQCNVNMPGGLTDYFSIFGLFNQSAEFQNMTSMEHTFGRRPISSRIPAETQESKAGNWKVGQSGSEDVNSYLLRPACQPDTTCRTLGHCQLICRAWPSETREGCVSGLFFWPCAAKSHAQMAAGLCPKTWSVLARSLFLGGGDHGSA